jgi:hypothetical protein
MHTEQGGVQVWSAKQGRSAHCGVFCGRVEAVNRARGLTRVCACACVPACLYGAANLSGQAICPFAHVHRCS